MKKLIILLLCSAFIYENIFAGKPIQKEPSPLSVLNTDAEKNSWCEHNGYAFIKDYGNLHYWLYDSYKYHDGDITELFEKIVKKWFQNGLGYFVDSEYITYSPNKNLAESVKNLMKEYGSDVSVTFLLPEQKGGFASVVFNSYDKDSGIYTTYVYRGTKAYR